MRKRVPSVWAAGFVFGCLTAIGLQGGAAPAQAQDKPNIILLVSDDTGYGDLGPYGGGVGRGMPTLNIDRLATEGMTLFSFYAQPSCTPGRAAMQTGRIPNRSGMTTVSFQGQGGGLPAAEWTLASVLKTVGYQTFFTGKWHLGESDYALPNAQGYDEMMYAGLYHLNAFWKWVDPIQYLMVRKVKYLKWQCYSRAGVAVICQICQVPQDSYTDAALDVGHRLPDGRRQAPGRRAIRRLT